eukprot:1455978-Pyramimonas_sp.AAC.1
MIFQPAHMVLEVAQCAHITQRILLTFSSGEWHMGILPLGKITITSCRAEMPSVQECSRKGKANDQRRTK